ncbi:hypothetical protein BJ138DRAFT_1110188 [Hygrophoropsis aurantiaca]|uniref:Uncharacterized protein n=1 Tax=Hygrophoropsis aurantiaca TaxID=72124 RepID=A0ACB8AP96_9AGAM|nr:hypothetical protein BJ138DRAFT_1110188 [Hygrophoropsis aurantiaca]
MAPTKTGKTDPKPKKEKVFHPDSRKASQMGRTHLRKGKMAEAATKRVKKQAAQVDVYGFFYHALPPEGVLSLDELHAIIREVWMTRHDAELDREKSARRKGRPKSTKETKLEEIKLRETEEYRTGMEVPDLTHGPTVELFRRWDQKEVPFIQQLRFIRISSADPLSSFISRPGSHHSLKEPNTSPLDHEMSVENSLLSEPPSRFASTIVTMDGPI